MKKRIFPYRSPDIDQTERKKHPFDELVDQVYHLPHPRQRASHVLLLLVSASVAPDDPHKLWWVIDQIARALTGDYYPEWRKLCEKGAVYEPGYWETGDIPTGYPGKS